MKIVIDKSTIAITEAQQGYSFTITLVELFNQKAIAVKFDILQTVYFNTVAEALNFVCKNLTYAEMHELTSKLKACPICY
jgi:hypothetical protein